MDPFLQQLAVCLEGQVCFVGLGNREHGDDGAGMALIDRLQTGLPHPSSLPSPPFFVEPLSAAARFSFLRAGTQLESHLHRLTTGTWDHVVLLDAADFGALPGSVALLDRAEMRARFPQVSTHRLSLGLLAGLIESAGRSRAWLLAIQPTSLRAGAQLSPEVQQAVALLAAQIVARRGSHAIAA